MTNPTEPGSSLGDEGHADVDAEVISDLDAPDADADEIRGGYCYAPKQASPTKLQ